MRLERLAVRGFKSIAELDLKLDMANVLIGANGAGKSNFIALFEFIGHLADRSLNRHIERAGGVDAFFYLGQRETAEIALDFFFPGHGYHCRLVPGSPGGVLFRGEFCTVSDQAGNETRYDLGSGHDESCLDRKVGPRSESGAMQRRIMDNIQSWRVYHFHETGEQAPLRKPGELKDYRFLRSDASNLAAFLHHIRINHRDYYDNIISTIQLVAPFFDDFILQPIPLSPDEILLEWKQKGYEQSFKANIFSDGTLRFICLAVLLLQPEPPATIFLDEPELGLHPYALSLLADLIRVASQTTQLIVSTQSVSLVNHFAPEDIIVVDREGTRSIFRRLSREEMQEWLDDYSLGELWEKNILGGRPQ